MKWKRTKVSFKAYSWLLKDDFLLLKALKSKFKKQKKVHVTLCLTPPLECHVLFEWPLHQYLSTFWVWFPTFLQDYRTIWRPSWLQFPSSQTSSSEIQGTPRAFSSQTGWEPLLYTLRKSSGLMFILSWLKFSF